QRSVHNVYSPTHSISVNPKGDHEAKVEFEAKKAILDRDLKLYFSLGKSDVGFTAMTHRPDSHKDGHFMFLISPRAELAKSQHVARDIVFVLDISGSMAGKKMEQAQKAVKHCRATCIRTTGSASFPSPRSSRSRARNCSTPARRISRQQRS